MFFYRRGFGLMQQSLIVVGAVVATLTLSGCDDPEERADVGYTDGYAVGYNTACKIRATLVEGDFENADYARAYARGQTDGTIACNADRKAGNVR